MGTIKPEAGYVPGATLEAAAEISGKITGEEKNRTLAEINFGEAEARVKSLENASPEAKSVAVSALELLQKHYENTIGRKNRRNEGRRKTIDKKKKKLVGLKDVGNEEQINRELKMHNAMTMMYDLHLKMPESLPGPKRSERLLGWIKEGKRLLETIWAEKVINTKAGKIERAKVAINKYKNLIDALELMIKHRKNYKETYGEGEKQREQDLRTELAKSKQKINNLNKEFGRLIGEVVPEASSIETKIKTGQVNADQAAELIEKKRNELFPDNNDLYTDTKDE